MLSLISSSHDRINDELGRVDSEPVLRIRAAVACAATRVEVAVVVMVVGVVMVGGRMVI